jgi:uncharacterized membrane protein
MDGDLTTVVVGYDDVDTALTDYADLKRVASERGEADDYEAAVIHLADDGYEVATTTVRERARDTWLGAGLGFVAGALIAPTLPIVIVGAGIGAVIGNVLDQYDAFKHGDLEEVQSLVDRSAATLIVLCDEANGTELRDIARSRNRRVVLSLHKADIDVLKRELQAVHPPLIL